MRKNKRYEELRAYLYTQIIEKAKEKELFLPNGNTKAKIDYIFRRYLKHYIFEVYRLTLRQMRNIYK